MTLSSLRRRLYLCVMETKNFNDEFFAFAKKKTLSQPISYLFVIININTTINDGSLGSYFDEERSELR